jgi:hypothetical protein
MTDLEVKWYGKWYSLADAVMACDQEGDRYEFTLRLDDLADIVQGWPRPGFTVMSFYTRQFRANGRLVEVGRVGQSPGVLTVVVS